MSGISITTSSGGIVPANPDIEFVQGNDGKDVGPDSTTHIWKLLGDNAQGVDVTGVIATNTTTITVFDATELQKGVVLLASNLETIAGAVTTKATTPEDIKAKLGAQTLNGLAYGGSQTAAINWLAEATDGQLPIGQTGGPPVLANITSTDGSIDVVNGPGTIDLSIHQHTGTGMTIGAVTTDLITFALPAVAGAFQFEARVKGFESTGPSASGYNIYATFRTDGINSTLVGDQNVFNEDPALVTADAYFVASGNDAILRVLGVAGLTINWSGEFQVT